MLAFCIAAFNIAFVVFTVVYFFIEYSIQVNYIDTSSMFISELVMCASFVVCQVFSDAKVTVNMIIFDVLVKFEW